MIKRVLLLDGYARQSLPLAKGLKKNGCTVGIICFSKLDVGYASRYPDKKLLWHCDKFDFDEQLKLLIGILKNGEYELVVPLTDNSAHLLAENKVVLSEYAKISMEDKEIFDFVVDKNNVMRLCMENGIPCPKTYFGVSSLEKFTSLDITYPIVIKPISAYGAMGFKRLDSSNEAIEYIKSDSVDLSHSVVQEFIPQTAIQYTTVMFTDGDVNVKTALVFSKHRWIPLNGGTSVLNISAESPEISEMCSKLIKLVGWKGLSDVDLILDPRDNTPKVLEINTRATACTKMCFETGADVAKQLLQLYSGEPVSEYLKYRAGQRLRNSQVDLIWFFKSPDRFRAKPSWFDIRHTKDMIFSLSDPLPWLAFSVQGLSRYKNEMKKRNG